MTVEALTSKEQRLESRLRQLGSVIVAYSGGVDSSLLAYYARKEIGTQAHVVIALSASLSQEELEAARSQAKNFNWDLIEVQTKEIDNPDYVRNDERRCYFCKRTLFTELEDMARASGIHHIVYGANVDDMQDYRPGHQAAKEFSVLSPLQEAGLEKSDIRELAKQAGLPSWDRPQAACLASRFPTFQPVTVEGLATVDKAEQFLHGLGFKQVRVRHFGEQARVEIDAPELPRLLNDEQLKQQVVERLQQLGYADVVIDPNGYRRGAANIFLQQPAAGTTNALNVAHQRTAAEASLGDG